MHPLSLDNITIAAATPSEMARIARTLGCGMVNLRFFGGSPELPLPCDYVGDAAQRREAKALFRDGGVEVGIAEHFRLGPDVVMSEFDAALDAAAELGAKSVNSSGFDPDPGRQSDSLNAFCDYAARWGLDVALEFFKRSKVDSLDKALALVRATPKATLVIDALHVTRTGASLEQIAQIEPERIAWVQLCDGPAEVTAVYTTTEGLFNRMIPGEGEFRLRELLAAIPPDAPIGLEVPNRARQSGLTHEDWARQVVTASRRLLESWGVKLKTL